MLLRLLRVMEHKLDSRAMDDGDILGVRVRIIVRVIRCY